jgi:archaellum component FlaC
MWEFFNKAPPWMVVLFMLSIGGTGGAGIFSWLQPNGEIKKSLDKIETRLTDISAKIDGLDRRQDNFKWRLENHSDRLGGQTTKNREQDKVLHDLERSITRMEVLKERVSP